MERGGKAVIDFGAGSNHSPSETPSGDRMEQDVSHEPDDTVRRHMQSNVNAHIYIYIYIYMLLFRCRQGHE